MRRPSKLATRGNIHEDNNTLMRISREVKTMAVNIVMSIASDGHNDSEDIHYDRM
jgi:hypothetical protein